LRKQLELLVKVHRIDANIKNCKMLEIRYQNEMEKIEQEALQKEEFFNKEKERLTDSEKKQHKYEQSLKVFEEQKQKHEDRLLAIKTNKEYQAALHEIDTIRKSISDTEDLIIKGMDEIEQERAAAKQAEQAFAAARNDLEHKKKQLEQELKDYIEDVERQKQTRESLVQQIDPAHLDNYLKIQKLRGGSAVALAEDEHCMGCSMKIPPQVYNEVIICDKIINCPNCGRILFVEYEDDKEEQLPEAENKQEPAEQEAADPKAAI